MGEPLIIAAPGVPGGGRTSVLASSLDLLPTMLEWANAPFTPYPLNGITANLTGKSLLPYLGRGHGGDGDAGSRRPAAAEAAARAAVPVQPRSAQAPPPPIPANATRIYSSFQLHEIDEYYPMRV